MPLLPSSRHARAALAAALFALLGLALVAAALRPGLERADFAFTTGGEVRSLDPHAVTGVPEGRVIRLLYEGLVARDPRDLSIVPAAAESWTASPDALQHTFTLRADAHWSNGDPLTAHDFEWSFRRLLEPATASDYAGMLACVAGASAFSTGASDDWSTVGIRALDERTLEFRLVGPTPYFLDLLACPVFAPVHRGSLESLRARYPGTWASEWTKPEHLVVNGPFQLVERRIADRTRFARNELYWDASNVALRTVDVLAIESWSSAVNLYLAGELDWVDGAIPANLASALAGREDYRPSPYLAVYFYRVNTTRPPLDDRRVRQALAYAISRREVCERVLKAGQQPALTFVPTAMVGYRSLYALPEDAGAARSVLGLVGYGPGEEQKRLSFEVHFNSGETHRDVAEVVADQWREVLGAEVGLRNQEWKSFLDAQSRLDYDVSRSSWIADYADPSTFLEIWTTGNDNNRTGWSDAEYDRLIERARTVADPGQRRELYQAAERILLVELPCIPIFGYVTQNLVDPRLGGFAANALNDQAPARWYWRDDAELARARAADRAKVERVESHGPRAGLYPPSRTAEAAK